MFPVEYIKRFIIAKTPFTLVGISQVNQDMRGCLMLGLNNSVESLLSSLKLSNFQSEEKD
jgi:hypothetical protein